MSVVILLLALMAATIVPNLVSQKDARQVRLFFSSVQDMAREARTVAVQTGQTVTLRLTEGADRLETVQPRVETAADESRDGRNVAVRTPATGAASRTEDETVTVRRLTMPDLLQAARFRSGEEDRSASDWELRFYPDGTCDGGGLEWNAGGETVFLAVSPQGDVSLGNGDLPEQREERWTAGEYEKRQQ